MPATAVLAPAPLALDYTGDSIACSNASCREALSHVDSCTCYCGGLGHGAPYRAGRRAAAQRILDDIARTGDVFGGAADACLTEDDDDLLPAYNHRQAATRRSVALDDDDECF